MRRGWMILTAIVIVVLAAVWLSELRPDAEVAVLQPERATIQAWIEDQATTHLPQDTLVAMPIAGWLEPITLREGDSVSAGQVVAQLSQADLNDRVQQVKQQIAVLETQLRRTADHRLEKNALVEAEAAVKAIDETVSAAAAKLKATQAIRDFASSEFERISSLTQSGAANDRERREAEMQYRSSEADLQSDALELAALKTLAAVSYIGPKFIRDYIDRKKFEAEETESRLAEARAALEIEQRNLERATITAPADGVVLERHNTRHQFLPAGTPLLTIGNLDDLEVIAEILSERVTRIKVGDVVEIIGKAIPDEGIKGRVRRIYPAGFKKISSLGVEQQRVNVAIALNQRPPRLGVGFRVYVRIIYDQAEDVLTVPRTSLLRTKHGGWQVLLVKDGVLAFQEVKVGLLNDQQAEIIAGLDANSLVVAQPTSELDAGLRVSTRAIQ